MPHCFEMRFHTPRPLSPWTDRLEEEFAAASFKQPLQLYRPHGMNTQEGWLVVKSCGYADLREAEASGALLRDGLLIVAAKQKVGVEFRSGRTRATSNAYIARSGRNCLGSN